MTDIHKIIGGAVAGGVAPLANYAANAFAAGDSVILTSLPLGLILVFAIIGAVTAFFTEKAARHFLGCAAGFCG